MVGVGSALSVNGAIFAISGQGNSESPSAVLAASRRAVSRALGTTGFVYVLGQLRDNFETYLTRKPFEIEVGDLKPGMLPDIADWVAAKVSGSPDRALQMQANVQPRRAMSLLT